MHASLIARRARSGWVGVLLRGASGAGKSDLALRTIGCGWRLVADDRVRLWTSGDRLYGAPPVSLRDLCEARGQGMAVCAALPFAPVALAVDLVEMDAAAERQPLARTVTVEGVRVASIQLRARDASAPVRLLHALAAAGAL